MHPTGYGAELSEHLQASFDDLWRLPVHVWIRKGPHAGFLPMIRSFFLQWVVDNWTCADWFLLDTTYPNPTTPLERGINRLSTLYASEMNRRYVEWETLGFDALTGWTAGRALEHYWLDERVEEHREVFAELRKLTLDHASPVARYWIMKCFVRFGDALMRSLGHAMAARGVAAEHFLGFAGQPERMSLTCRPTPRPTRRSSTRDAPTPARGRRARPRHHPRDTRAGNAPRVHHLAGRSGGALRGPRASRITTEGFHG